MRIPIATYRIQFGPRFTFGDCRTIVDYLKRLGMTDIYASPVFKARKGSLHGYDVVDPSAINPELGGEEGWRELLGLLAERNMGWIQDIVPNHMAYDYANDMLMDVMEWGKKSPFLEFFDISWDHVYENLNGKLLAPFLGNYYGKCLERGDIRLEYHEGEITVNYYDLKFPLRMESYAAVLGERSETRSPRPSTPDNLARCLDSLQRLVRSRDRTDPERTLQERARMKKQMRDLFSGDLSVCKHLQKRLDTFNGNTENPASFDLLDRLLSQQHFRLSFWKVATEEVNYRRFFNVNELICLRTEQKEVFDYIHSLLFRMTEEDGFSGLRIDHIDGLYDPAAYLKRLRKKTGDLFIVAEKILAFDEDLPDWPVQGTTGYEALNRINGIFCKRENRKKFDRIYSRFTAQKTSLPEMVRDKKRMIIGKHMAGDVDNLAHAVKKIAGHYRSGRDFTLYGLRRAIVEILAQFPVYRTYRNSQMFSAQDKRIINRAVDDAGKKIPEFHFELQFIRHLLFQSPDDDLSEEDKAGWMDFGLRFQQFTGPLMAKGFEDTALYVYNRFLSLNEVGGDPGRFGLELEDFHQFSKQRSLQWPHAMTATATHDTKRGEDVRARLNVLSEIPDEWAMAVGSWRRMNRGKKKRVGRTLVPDRNDEYFLYQSMVGAFPFDRTEISSFKERMKTYAVKAVREAKIHTEWIKPDTAYEQALQEFVDVILTPSRKNVFLEEFLGFQQKIAYSGVYNSLSQTLLKLTVPGVPDFYQGTELWDLNLVDPDNRRPVDFAKRSSLLDDLIERSRRDILDLIKELLLTPQNGRIKLFLIYRALRLRQRRTEVFKKGAYIPLETAGKWKNNILSFVRDFEGDRSLSIVPRFLTSLIEEQEAPLGKKIWGDTSIRLPDEYSDNWTDAITGHTLHGCRTVLPLSEVFLHFPVALLFNGEP